MPKTFFICLALISLLLVLTEASKKGKSKGGSWGNSGTNRNPSYPNTGGNWNPSHNNPGSNWNPSHNQPGSNWNPNAGSNWNQGGGWGTNYNPGGSSYNNKWKPPKSKPNLKVAAGAAAAGAIGGFMLGNAFSNMRYRFDNDYESRYYNTYRNQMPDQVYRPMYHDNVRVTEDRFVTDCYNTTMTEFVIKPSEGKNSTDPNDTDIKVKSTVIRQMCVSEYRRRPQYYGGNGLRLLLNPMLIFISLFVYFVVQ
ncbi:major prion protein [Gastrophryne carolinensis]